MDLKRNLAPTVLLFGACCGLGAMSVKTTNAAVQNNNPLSGKQLFLKFCADCHGTDGKGGVPATPALRQMVPDLTVLSQRHGGQYPDKYVRDVLRGGVKNIEDHGTSEMPVWGKEFKTIPTNGDAKANRRIDLLARYLETLQVK